MYRLPRERPDDEYNNDPRHTNQRERITPSNREKRNIEERKAEKEQKGKDQPLQEGGFAPFQEGVIEIREHAEVPLVSKEARVVEEISVNKEVKERKEKVTDSVRKTEVDVEKLRKEDLPRD